MNRSYDIIVAGGGPAGSMAALAAARKGASVLVLEKDRDIGYPVRCGEAVSKEDLARLVDIQPHWIASTIDVVNLISPSMMEVHYRRPEMGYTLHRRMFDYDLAAMAAEAGAQICTKANVVGLIQREGWVQGVQAIIRGESKDIPAKIVIAADGVESRIARWAGLNSVVKLKDMVSCVQASVGGVNIIRNQLNFYFSSKLAPGGYVWVFPKGGSKANIGLGVDGKYSREKSASRYLEEFIAQFFPEASILTYVAGGVPCSGPMKKMTSHGFMVVGDAAHHTNPMTGGGIVSGMRGGVIAGEIAAGAIEHNDVSGQRLSHYQKLWYSEIGNNYKRTYRIKEAINKLDDSDLDTIAGDLQEISPEQLTLTQLFKTALKSHPSLLFDAARVFAGF